MEWRNCEKLRVIIVGSRADVVKSSSKSQRGGLKSIAVDTLEVSFRSVEIVAKVQVDSHRSDHSGVSMLRKQLSTVCNKMEGGESLSFNACCLLAYLKSGFDSLLYIHLWPTSKRINWRPAIRYTTFDTSSLTTQA